jgi:diguanylate cyclase (GGDEF)-like protein/PAS domain S-box-containing protein
MKILSPGKWSRPLVQFTASALTMWLGFVALGSTEHFLFLWPLTAVQVSIALNDWRNTRARSVQLLACGTGDLLACSLLGMPLWVGIWQTAVQVLEVAGVVAILYPHVLNFDDLKQRAHLLRFGVAAVLVPLVAVALAAKPISALTHATLIQSWLIAAPSDSLGIAVVLPVLLFFSSGEFRSFEKLRPYLRTGAPALLLFLASTVAIFAQGSMTFLFLVFPPLVVVSFVMGLEGAAFAAVAAVAVAGWSTAHGHGPIGLIQGGSPELHIVALQIFLGTIVAVAMPVGALLDEQHRAERSAQESESIYKILIQNAEDMIVLSTLNGARRFVSPAVLSITGWTDEEFEALGYLGAVHEDDREFAQGIIDSLIVGEARQTFRHRLLRKDGNSRWVESSVRGFTDSQSAHIAGYVATVRDISQHVESEDVWTEENAALASQNEHLSDLALKDELTGISNRRAFNLFLDYEFERHARSGTSLALLMIDVDHFKKYNDTLGHPAGDACLRQLGQTLEFRVRRSNDRVARIGGEEFAAILPQTDEAGARKVAQDLLDAVNGLAIEHPGSPQGRVSVSIGVASLSPRHGTDSAALIQQADRALYESKRTGRNRASVSAD